MSVWEFVSEKVYFQKQTPTENILQLSFEDTRKITDFKTQMQLSQWKRKELK